MVKNLIKLISEEKIYPIIRCKEAAKAEDVANALIEGGIKVLEINIENPSLYGVIENVSKKAAVLLQIFRRIRRSNPVLNCFHLQYFK